MVYRYGRSYNYLLFSIHLICIGVLVFYNGKDRSARVCLPEVSFGQLGAKTIKKNTNSTQNKSETRRAKQYEVTSFQSTDCELSTETCSKNVYSGGRHDVTTHVTLSSNHRCIMVRSSVLVYTVYTSSDSEITF